MPLDGAKSPEIVLKSVVLPAPFEPSTARRSPALTDSDTSASAVKRPEAPADAGELEGIAAALPKGS